MENVKSNEFKFDSLLADMLRVLPLDISNDKHRELIELAIENTRGELSENGQAQVALELLDEQAGVIGRWWFRSDRIFTKLRDIIGMKKEQGSSSLPDAQF